MVVRKKETAVSAIGSMFADVKTDNAFGSGLGVKVTRVGAGLASHVDGLRYCHNVPTRARIAVLARMSKGRGRSLFVSTRRLIATSRFARGFSFGVNRDHGIIAPSVFTGVFRPQILTGSRAGSLCARRFLVRGTSYTRTACPPRRKDGQIRQSVLGAFAMMRTLNRNVSTVFPSIPEPIYQPVTSATAGSCEPVSYDVSSDLNAVFDRCAGEYVSANREPSLFNRTIRLNVLRGVAVDVLRFCDETLGRTYTSSKVIGG